MEANRTLLLRELLPKKQEYLLVNNQPQKHQFIRAYTRSYSNLGVNSTKRNETHHNVIKSLINREMPLAESVYRIKEQIQEIEIVYDVDINKQCIKAPCLLDRKVFAKLKHLLTWYSLGKL